MLIHPKKSCLLVVDIQEKLAPAIHEKEILIQNSKWLIEIANILNITIMTSEQYPQGIGHTIDDGRSGGEATSVCTSIRVHRSDSCITSLYGYRT